MALAFGEGTGQPDSDCCVVGVLAASAATEGVKVMQVSVPSCFGTGTPQHIIGFSVFPPAWCLAVALSSP